MRIWGYMGEKKEKNKRDQPGQGDSGQEGHGKGAGEWAGQFDNFEHCSTPTTRI